MSKQKNLLKLFLSCLCFSFCIFSILIYGKFTFPSPTDAKYLNDYVGIVDSSSAQNIMAIGYELEVKTGAQVAIVIINSTQGIPIEDYSVHLFREWGIGSSEKDNGLLILLALQDKNWRVEVGRGLEGAIPDLLSHDVMENIAKPNFIEGHYGKGLLDTYITFCDMIASEYQVTLSSLSSPPLPYNPSNASTKGSNMGILFMILLLVDFLFNRGRISSTLLHVLFWSNINRRGPRGGSGGNAGGGFSGGSSNGGGSSGSW